MAADSPLLEEGLERSSNLLRLVAARRCLTVEQEDARAESLDQFILREPDEVCEPAGKQLLGIDDLKRPNDAFEVNESLTMKVTRVDVPNHRLVLSVKAWLQDQDDVTLAEWTAARNRARAQAAEEEKLEAAKSEARPKKERSDEEPAELDEELS